MAEARYLISDAARQVGVETHVLRYWEDELELAIPRNDMGHRYYTDYHIRLFCQIRDLKDRGYQLKAIRNALNKMSGAMENITITEELMEEEMKAAWKENHARAELTKEKAAGGAERQNEAERREGQTADGQAGRNEAAGGQIPRSGGAGPAARGNGKAGNQDGQRGQDSAAEQELRVEYDGEAEMPEASPADEDADGVGQAGGSLVPAGDQKPALPDAEEKMARFQDIMNHIIGQAVEANMARISREITEDVSDAVSENVTDRVMKEVEYLLRVSDEKEEERFKQLDETIRAYQNKGKGRAEAAAAKTPFFRNKRFGRSGKKLF